MSDDNDWGSELTAGILLSSEARRNMNMRQKFFVMQGNPLVDLGEFLVAAGRPVTAYRQHELGIEIEMEVSANQLERVARKAASRGLIFGGIAQLSVPEPEPAPEPPKRTRKSKKVEEPEVEEALEAEAETAE